MASDYRRGSGHKEHNSTRKMMWSESSDTDSDVPQFKKPRHNRQKSSLKTIHLARQKNISLQTSSSESSSSNTKENSKRKYMTVIDKSNTKKGTDNSGCQRQMVYQFNKSDNASIEDSIRKRRKRVAIKKAMQMDDDKCYRSSNEIVVNKFIKKCEETEREKQANAQNFKPFIKKIIEDLKNTFLTFRSQVHRIQLKYLEPDTVTYQDAADTIFIFSSIICKLKEELTEKQQNLTNLYINSIMKCNNNGAVSDVNYEQCNKDFQKQVEASSGSSTDSQIFSPDICQDQSIKTTKSLSGDVEENDKEKLPVQETNNFINNYQTKDNAIIQNNESMVSRLDSLKTVMLFETPSKESVGHPKNAEDSKSNWELSNKNSTSTSEKLAGDVNRHTAKESIIEIESSSDNDSNMSTCSTVMISSHNCKHENSVRHSLSHDIMQNDELHEKGEASRLNCSSDDYNKKTKSSIKDLAVQGHNAFQLPTEKVGVPSNNQVLISEQDFRTLVIYGTQCENHCFKAQNDNRDRRLNMNGQVLVKKFTLD